MMQIVELAEKHWGDAAALVAARVRELRRAAPILPQQYEDGGTVLPLIADLAAQVPGVAAIEQGRLAGFLFAMVLPSFKSKRTAYSPVWANGVQAEDASRIYQELYAGLAPRWLANGCVVHALSVLAHDRAGLDGLYWLGFGLNNVDAVRDLTPLAPADLQHAADLSIRRATASNIVEIMRLGEGLRRHLAAAPIYLPYMDPDTAGEYRDWLVQPGNVQWLAYRGAMAVAEVRCEPTNDTAGAIAADPGTTFITSAYTMPAERNSGVASALLAQLLEHARAAGCERCVTDFESANLPGARFWMRHFQPITFSVLRYVDERALYAHAERQAEDIW